MGYCRCTPLLTQQNHIGSNSIQYGKLYKLLAEGNFVLSACEGLHDGIDTLFYDLYRLVEGKIVEHWDSSEK
jgi:predicted SnoaL-like aldol condensation-catalyzing enzyme